MTVYIQQKVHNDLTSSKIIKAGDIKWPAKVQQSYKQWHSAKH